MARLTATRRYKRLAGLIYRASNKMIPYDHIRLKHRDAFSADTIYEILSPVTNTWQEIRVCELAVAAMVLPQSVCDAMDYYMDMVETMRYARDIQVYNGDLRPICAEEKQIFGIREGENNPCFPKGGSYRSTHEPERNLTVRWWKEKT
jgi:hypothetical protein